MLEELRITGLGVIEESVLELGPGLSVVTGETGAGKTMVVTALGLLLGGRADPGAVRTGSSRARVEGVVALDALPAELSARLAARLVEAGGDTDDGHLLVTRQVAAEGRSRAFAGGSSVPVTTLGALMGPLVAVHGQSDQLRLLQPGEQRAALDRFAGEHAATAAARYRAAWAALRDVEAELHDVTTRSRERAQEAERLRVGLEAVEAVDPKPGEDRALAAEESRLGAADELRAAAELAREALSATDGGADALAAVSAARRRLDAVRDDDPAAADLADRLAELSYLLSDLAADVASYAAGLESDPARLAAVSARRSALAGLTRLYGEDVDAVLAWSEHAAARVLELDGSDERAEELRARRSQLRAELADAGAAWSAARSTAAEALADAVTLELAGLAMPHARLGVDVRQSEVGDDARPEQQRQALDVGGRRLRAGPEGLDDVEVLLAPNPGAAPRPLSRGASGGELSRVMLALEVVLAAGGEVPTFVFDEVDAGVGGKAAVEIGRRLAALARHAQVLVVTHLPQVAAFADRHVVVHKTDDGVVTTSGLEVLDDEGRVRELSRMLAGLEGSSTAQAHAEELLATAREARSA